MSDSTRAAQFQAAAMPYMDAAYNLARWLTGNDQDAEDVTQEAFLRAFKFFDGFRGGDARTWLLTIVRNTFYPQYRKAKGRDESTEFDEEYHSSDEDCLVPAMTRPQADPAAILAGREDVRLLDQAIGELPDEFREALVLRELEDLSYKQIAATLDVPIGTVMSRIARARGLLLQAYKRLSGESHEMHRSAKPNCRLR